jgi:PEP-CTERM motif
MKIRTLLFSLLLLTLTLSAVPAALASLVVYTFSDITVPSNPGYVLYANQYAPGLLLSTGSPDYTLTVGDLSFLPPLNHLVGSSKLTNIYDSSGNLIMEVNPGSSITGFKFGGDNFSGKIATLDLYQSSSLIATLDMIGNGNVSAPQTVDLSTYSNINKVVVRDQTDAWGVGFYDIAVNAGGPSAVPEPSTYALFSLGLGGLTLLKRRQKKA